MDLRKTPAMAILPIDNLRVLLDGGSPRWMPFSFDVGAIPGMTEPIRRRFVEATGAAEPSEHFDTDWRLFSLPARFGGSDPAALHEALPPGTTFDEWGIGHWAGGLEGTLDKNYPPLARAASIAEIESLPSPVIATDADTSPVAAWHAAGYPVFGYAGSIYEWSWWLRGMERFMMDLMSEPALAEAVLRKVEHYTTRLALATAEAGVDVLCFYDDAGMQRGMQIAPALWRQFIRPAWKRVLDAVRGRFPQTRFFLHCCGKIDAIVHDIVELGFHVLHPVQPECMDFEAVYRQYGSRIVLAATISAQRLFPFGSPDAVRAEVRRLAKVAADRRAILMPSNRIQPETPWENVVAFAEACREIRGCGLEDGS
jgi:uroporphyrinogen decarboxylase